MGDAHKKDSFELQFCPRKVADPQQFVQFLLLANCWRSPFSRLNIRFFFLLLLKNSQNFCNFSNDIMRSYQVLLIKRPCSSLQCEEPGLTVKVYVIHNFPGRIYVPFFFKEILMIWPTPTMIWRVGKTRAYTFSLSLSLSLSLFSPSLSLLEGQQYKHVQARACSLKAAILARVMGRPLKTIFD